MIILVHVVHRRCNYGNHTLVHECYNYGNHTLCMYVDAVITVIILSTCSTWCCN